MSVYVDSSVLLRIVFGERDGLPLWPPAERMVASVILHVECLRSIDRARLARAAPAEAIAIFRAALSDLIEKIDLVDISSNVLLRASQSLPFPIRTLDAIHLATAIEWRERNDPTLTFATHDHQLALAARALRFAVIGA